MNHRTASDLILNSYKVDTATLHNSIKQLNQMKQQLETTISQYKSNETGYITENQRLKSQIQMLQKQIKDRPTLHEECRRKINLIEDQLKKEKTQALKYKQMYEVERKNHEEVREFYQKKLQAWKNDHHLLVNKYEQKINKIASQININKGASNVSRSKKSLNSRRESIQSNIRETNNVDSNRTGNDPPLPYSKNKTEEEPNEQIFEATMRKIYFLVRQMGITTQEYLKLPQFKKLKQNRNPTRKQLINFMKNPPIGESSKEAIENNINYLQSMINGRMSGPEIINLMAQKIEEYQLAEKMNSQDLLMSGITPSLKRSTSYGFIEEKEEEQQKNKQRRPSLPPDILKLQSEGSFIY